MIRLRAISSGFVLAAALGAFACSGDSTGPGSTSNTKTMKPTEPSLMVVAEDDDGANWETEARERFQAASTFSLYGWGESSTPPDGGGGGGGSGPEYLNNEELAGLAWGEGWDSMHDNEKLFYIRNWEKWKPRIDMMRTISRLADSLAAAKFNRSDVRDGYVENAWKHALWTCGMVRKWGWDDAQKASDVHEDWPGNPPNEKAMDLNNNLVGMNYAMRTTNCFDDVTMGQAGLVWIYQ